MRLRKVRRVIDQAPVTGDVPLTPIQHWFFSQSLPHDHFNQSVMLSSADRINESAMRKALAQLAVHHDALRMVCGTQNGSVIQYNRADNLSEEELFTFETHDVRGKGSLQEEHAAIEQAAARIQTSIRLETGPLVAVGLFHAADGDHLLLSIHHLVIDGVSWRILFEDLTACYRQALEGKEAALPAKPIPIRLTRSKSLIMQKAAGCYRKQTTGPKEKKRRSNRFRKIPASLPIF